MNIEQNAEILSFSKSESENSECSCKYAKLNCKSHPKKHVSWSGNQISFGRKRQQFNPFKKSKRISSSKLDNSACKLYKEAYDVRYGNYHQYYGYRNQGREDSRLLCMKREWFDSKDVLDIGCNAGHFTLSIARDFSPNSIIGVDIDSELIKIAKRNVRHYIKYDALSDSDFPLSLVLSYGPIVQSLDPKFRYPVGNFPFNVQFIQANYILPTDELLEWQEPCFDTILCLSLTKWIHLNWGDDGVKRLFHRVYAHLHPGGYFILEAQSFQSYSKRRKITDEIFKNYSKIMFYPEMFNEYLLKEVGFKSCELIDTPAHSSKGFSRPIYLFIKGDEEGMKKTPKHIIYNFDSESSQNYSDVEQLSD